MRHGTVSKDLNVDCVKADWLSIHIASLALTVQAPKQAVVRTYGQTQKGAHIQRYPSTPYAHKHTHTHTVATRRRGAAAGFTKFKCRGTCVPKDFDESGFVLTTRGTQ